MSQALRPLLNRLNSPIIVALIVATSYTAFLLVHLKKWNYRTSYLVTAGDKFCDPSRVPANLIVIPNSTGYDGEFYYRLALNPFTHRITDYGITLDTPAYRDQRILYPSLVWALSLGRSIPVARNMAIVNLLCLFGIGYLVSGYARSRGHHALWGLFGAFNIAAIMTIARDTAELVAVFFMVLALLLLERRKVSYAALTIGASAFARETALVAAAAILLVMLWQNFSEKRLWRDPQWLWFLLPFALYYGWQVHLSHLWGENAISSSGNRIGVPFLGIIELLRDIGAVPEAVRTITAAEVVFILVFAGLTAIAFRGSTASPAIKLTWFFFTVIGLSYTHSLIYIEDWGFLRLLPEFFTLGALIQIASPSKIRIVGFTLMFALWLALAANVIAYR